MSIGNKYFFEKIIFLFRMALGVRSLQKSPGQDCIENLYIPAGRLGGFFQKSPLQFCAKLLR